MTDNGNFILDWQFDSVPDNWLDVDHTLHYIPGNFSAPGIVFFKQSVASNFGALLADIKIFMVVAFTLCARILVEGSTN